MFNHLFSVWKHYLKILTHDQTPQPLIFHNVNMQQLNNIKWSMNVFPYILLVINLSNISKLFVMAPYPTFDLFLDFFSMFFFFATKVKLIISHLSQASRCLDKL